MRPKSPPTLALRCPIVVQPISFGASPALKLLSSTAYKSGPSGCVPGALVTAQRYRVATSTAASSCLTTHNEAAVSTALLRVFRLLRSLALWSGLSSHRLLATARLRGYASD